MQSRLTIQPFSFSVNRYPLRKIHQIDDLHNWMIIEQCAEFDTIVHDGRVSGATCDIEVRLSKSDYQCYFAYSHPFASV
jgi:hypothetical protein